MKALIIIISAILISCSPDPTIEMKVGLTERQKRFEVTRVDVFSDDVAYNSTRAIYILVDKQTGKEYVGISGVGISQIDETGGKNNIIFEE